MEGCKRPQRTYIYHIYISKTYIDAEFDVESFRMVYLASKGRLGKVICEKHTFLNNLWPSTVRVSQRVVWEVRGGGGGLTLAWTGLTP